MSDTNSQQKRLSNSPKPNKPGFKNLIILAMFFIFPVLLTIFLIFLSKHGIGTYFIQGSAYEVFVFSIILCCIFLLWYMWKKNLNLLRYHRLFIVVLILISLFYLGFLREYHPKAWDFMSYYLAAKGMEEGINIYDAQAVTEFNRKHSYQKTTYLYTPLLAAVIGPLGNVGESKFFIFYEFANFYGLVFMLILLYLILLKYDILSRNTISVLIFLIFLINVPVIRTFIHGQINFHVMNLILLSILFFGMNDLISALMLCLAANLKLSPVLLVCGFILGKNWKWLYYFCLFQVLIIIITSIAYGYEYWRWFLEFMFKMNPPPGFRNNSLDSLISNLVGIVGLNHWGNGYLGKMIIIFAKMGAFCWLGWALFFAIKDGIFFERCDGEYIIYNSLPILIICMILASPYMWPHHFVFSILPFILLISCCKDKGNLSLYIVAYFCIFLVPVFDIFPFSYHRIIGVFLMVIIFSRAVLKKSYGLPDFMLGVERKLKDLLYNGWKCGK